MEFENEVNRTTVTDDEVKEEARLKELQSKKDTTEEEKAEIERIKEEKQTKYQKRIDQLVWRAKSTESALEEERRRSEELQRKIEDIEKEKQQPINRTISINREAVEVGDKKFYSDDALISMVANKEISEDQANKHYQARVKAEVAEEAYSRIKNEQRQDEEKRIRFEDAQDVLSKYPHFDKSNKDFNPNDPLYKLTAELYKEGYSANSRGLSLATKRAREILRLEEQRPDISDDLTVSRSRSMTGKADTTPKVVQLSEVEKEVALKMYLDRTNPSTNRAYTETEILAKATKAKNARIGVAI